ncbi:hypothetical protein ROT00_00355 [Agromyces mediolanus]|uniref:hypothetical protein n=1 Tax=Agromyces mediolanus TaxID=41986 RepID=UPI003837ACF6
MRYLTALGTADMLDELALEFDCYFVPVAGELRRRAPRCESLCRRLDGMLSSDTLGWWFDDLGSDDWNEIRSLAVEAVAAFDEAYGGASMDRFDDAGYSGIPGLENLYFEDSWVLEIVRHADRIAELRAAEPSGATWDRPIRHFLIFVDSAGAFEVAAESVEWMLEEPVAR